MSQVVKLGNKVLELRDWNPSGIAQQMSREQQSSQSTVKQPSSRAADIDTSKSR
jgi:hypothetical protein